MQEMPMPKCPPAAFSSHAKRRKDSHRDDDQNPSDGKSKE